MSSQLGIISDKDLDGYGEQVKTTAKKELNLGTKKSAPKKDVTVVKLDIGDDKWYDVLHKVVEFRDAGHDFDKITDGLKKKYDFTVKTEKHIKEVYDGKETK